MKFPLKLLPKTFEVNINKFERNLYSLFLETYKIYNVLIVHNIYVRNQDNYFSLRVYQIRNENAIKRVV